MSKTDNHDICNKRIGICSVRKLTPRYHCVFNNFQKYLKINNLTCPVYMSDVHYCNITQVRDYRRRELPKLEVECAPALVASSRAKFQVILTITIIIATIAINMIINIAIIECAPALVASSRAKFQVIIIIPILVIFIPVIIIIIIICTLFIVIPVIVLVIILPVNKVSIVRRKISE